MKHVKKFKVNEAWKKGEPSEAWDTKYPELEENKSNGDFLGKLLSKMGIEVTRNSEIIPRTKFAKFLCNMAVSDGLFVKIGDTYRLNEK
jgi:hypothetical protein